MLKYVEKILSAVVEFGIKECQDLANILLEDLSFVRFGVLHQEIDSIAFMERFAGNTFLADAIEKAMKNMGKLYSVSGVENPWDDYEKEEYYDGLSDYSEEEEAYEAYLDSLEDIFFEENN